MQFRHEQSYDAPADRVHEMLADPDFRKRVCAAQKATACTVSIEPDGAGMSVTVCRADDEILRLWDAPVRTPALRWGA